MGIEKKAFVNYTLPEDKKDGTIVVSLKLNVEDQEVLKDCQGILNQKKVGTAIKTLLYLGAKVILDKKTKYIIDTIFNNKRNNKRNNINDFD